MSQSDYKYTTREFAANAKGQHEKIETIAQFEAQGWEVVEENVLSGSFSGAKACCLWLICFPLAFFAYKNGKIVVTFRKAKN